MLACQLRQRAPRGGCRSLAGLASEGCLCFTWRRGNCQSGGADMRLLAVLSLLAAGALAPAQTQDGFIYARHTMVRDQIEARGVSDEATLAALRNVPRHEFVAEELRAYAYE